MKIYYDEGPPSIGMGAAGVFKKGESREIDDDLARQLLAKKSIVFKVHEVNEVHEVQKVPEAPAPASVKKLKEASDVGN